MSDRVYHWRRHDEAHDNCVAATACGRLVQVDDVTGDPGTADCPECELIAALLQLAKTGTVDVKADTSTWRMITGTNE